MRFRNCPETGRQLKALVSDAVSQAVISPPSLDHRVGALLEIARRVWDGHPEKTRGEAIANTNGQAGALSARHSAILVGRAFEAT
jgi:hypothetical protein